MFNCQVVYNSTLARVIAHDNENQVLRVVFTSGKGYDYPNVNSEDFNKLRLSESIGSSFNRGYRNRQDFQRVPDSEVSSFVVNILSNVSDHLIQV